MFLTRAIVGLAFAGLVMLQAVATSVSIKKTTVTVDGKGWDIATTGTVTMGSNANPPWKTYSAYYRDPNNNVVPASIVGNFPAPASGQTGTFNIQTNPLKQFLKGQWTVIVQVTDSQNMTASDTQQFSVP